MGKKKELPEALRANADKLKRGEPLKSGEKKVARKQNVKSARKAQRRTK